MKHHGTIPTPAWTSDTAHESSEIPQDYNPFESVGVGKYGSSYDGAESGVADRPSRWGEYLPGMNIPSGVKLGGGKSIRKITGNHDNRSAVANPLAAPYSGILMVHYYPAIGNQLLQGTAWLISPTVAITAGHVVIDAKRGKTWSKYQTMKVYQGVQGNVGSAASANVVGINTTKGWQNHFDSRYDFGVLFLDRPLRGHVFEFADYDESDLERMNVNVVGYPAEDPTKPFYNPGLVNRMAQHAGSIVDAQDSRLLYRMDTKGGNSGGPIIFMPSATQYYVVGIHTDEGSGDWNEGVRINDDVLQVLLSWRQ